MAFDDMTAFGAIRALTNCGIRGPEQVSVIGFDDIAHSSLLTPALTTVRQPMPEMGEMAVSASCCPNSLFATPLVAHFRFRRQTFRRISA
jgi:hypothetical protein